MTPDKARFDRLIADIEFRDWWFVISPVKPHSERDGLSPYYLQVCFMAPDAATPGYPTLQKGRKFLLSPHMTDSEVVLTAWTAVNMAVEHEAREDFRFKGQQILGPHLDVHAMARHLRSDADAFTDARKEELIAAPR